MANSSFLKYAGSNDEALKKEAKKILASVFENLSVDELNSLYSKDDTKNNPNVVASKLQHTILPFDQFEQPSSVMAPATDVATMEKYPGEDKIKIKVKKPINVVFQNTMTEPNSGIQEGAKVVDDKVVISLDKSKRASEDVYDPLESAPPLDLSNDESDNIEGEDRINQLLDIVKSNSGGIMPNVVAISGQPLPTDRVLIKQDNIRSVEEDPEGFSVVGMDNDIGSMMMAPPTKK